MLLDIGYKLFEPVGKMFEAHLSNAVRKWLSEKNDNEDDQHLVWLLTAHGAKGLEFDWVFVAGMNEGEGAPQTRGRLTRNDACFMWRCRVPALGFSFPVRMQKF